MTSTVIATLRPVQSQALFDAALRLVRGDVDEVQIDQCQQYAGDGTKLRTTYATGRGQGLTATVTEISGCGYVLPPGDLVNLPTALSAYTLLALETPYRAVPPSPRVIDLHAWLVARVGEHLATSGVPWCWTSTGPWETYCDWKDDIIPGAPLGDAFAWQASLDRRVS